MSCLVPSTHRRHHTTPKAHAPRRHASSFPLLRLKINATNKQCVPPSPVLSSSRCSI
ncbi:hypothetical protein BDV95DRAFT_580583 [Massariosphaeria phaeospora]|uniref:Uncharacterized protein n=1 Tax=Massariosphaeria phaeospora TaxID=100035 RepID=A0A7C8M5B3_9PLEO|nr:hypothetical protein BDV95DRAFT_580583 [Massariosphaeria phaeospora]